MIANNCDESIIVKQYNSEKGVGLLVDQRNVA